MGYIWNMFVCLEDWTLMTTILVFILTFLFLFYMTRRRPNVPPGPPLFPVIGNLPSLVGGDMFDTLDELRRKYGDVFGLYIGKELTVFLNGYTAIHDALVKKGSIFGKRPLTAFDKIITCQKSAIIFANGHIWKEKKSFLLQQFQDLCFRNKGKYIEQIINKELDHIPEHETTVNIESFMTACLANVIFTLFCKRRADLKDESLQDLIKIHSLNAKEFTKNSVLLNCLPFLIRVPSNLLGVKNLLNRVHIGYAIVDNFMKERTSTETETEHISCIVDQYRELGNSRANDPCDADNAFTESQLVPLCYEVVGAGSETTSTTIRWIILFLVRNPHIQQKMFLEIVDKFGATKPTWNDRKKLPYVQAVILEGLRIRPPAPLAIPHGVSRDLIFHGYLIPENTSVMVNINSCMKDPTVWKDPEEFLPERFLNEDKTDVVVPKEFIPFSLGNRSCPGETLARMELFLFISSLVQRFEFQAISEDSLPSVNGLLGLTWSPKPFLVKMTKRK